VQLNLVRGRHWPANPNLETKAIGIIFKIEKKTKKIFAWTGTKKLGLRVRSLKLDMQTAWDDLHLDRAARLSLVFVRQKHTRNSPDCRSVIVEEAGIGLRLREAGETVD
jgi:hypothetical protein